MHCFVQQRRLVLVEEAAVRSGGRGAAVGSGALSWPAPLPGGV